VGFFVEFLLFPLFVAVQKLSALPGVFSGSARKRFASLVFSQFKNRTSGGSNRSVNIPHSFFFIARGTDPPDF
jgi:hypothetical protein